MKIFLDANFLIYLNTLTGDERIPLDDLFLRLLKEELYTNLLVLDETLYISKTKYRVPYDTTLSFLKRIILPYAAPIAVEESDIEDVETFLLKYGLKPSDAIHLATMEKEGVTHIVTEDEEFDRIKETKRIWLDKKPRTSARSQA
ncbi:MAG: type II toxin-antitoxin system VapC family toxin [archaeon]